MLETVDAEVNDAVGATARTGFGPTADEALVYQSLPDGGLRAIDPERGAQRWVIALEEPIVSQPTLGAESILVRTRGGVAVLS